MKNYYQFSTRITLLLFLLLSFIFISSHAQDTAEKGNLVFFISDYIAPKDYDKYETLTKEFKKLADETNAPAYFVNYNGSSMNFGFTLGEDLSDLDGLFKDFETWAKDNPKIEELDAKFSNIIQYNKTRLWREDPTVSYMPEGYDNTIARPYIRAERNYILPGQVKRAKEILAEYLAEWKKQKISYRVLAVWNVFGEEQPCVQFVSWYKDREDWLISRNEVNEKVGEAKLTELNNKWSSILRKREGLEITARPDLSHSNE